ncbi:glycosyltransferase family 2 protein [Sphaerisporangium krabiense]|uniref:Glycosyltransferase involved in cell wall biosynthesis n=1 Tax=Sphaerisporangium krabiense TaxID=763782 RepID=A0A7W8Z4P8_9ACTN|nr:glycosyltransferase family 2 protein [Sphaerisporangium krabiense]MBB5627371.1 glycosyltransferase involved in cell wall biosynthesis [Sphaerisporangium krabiense]
MSVKVSVVVPVSEPGPDDDAFDACVRSLLEQSMPSDEYEVIFADDRSGDGTRERLDAVAAVRPNVRVLHLEHTGTPARGRNVGLAVARGEYVYLLGQRDRLERVALENMYRTAVETDADILIGRVVRGDNPPQRAFSRNRERADVLRDRLLGLPTAHKLFRRAFLDAREIRFPEIEPGLSEQAFVLRAYLTAKVIAVLADQICCHIAPPSQEAPDPRAYAAGLRAILDIVDAHSEPGDARERLYAHWFRAGVLRLLGGRHLRTDQRGALFIELRALTAERFPDELDRHLPVHLRARAVLLRSGDLGRLVALSDAARGTSVRAELREVGWDEDTLIMDLAVELVGPDGAPVTFKAEGDRLHWTPPVAGFDLPAPLADVTDAVERARMEVYIRHQDHGLIFFIPVHGEVCRSQEGDRVRVWAVGRARLDVATVALGRPLRPGEWEVHVRMYTGAQQARTRVAGRRGAPLSCVGVLAGRPPRLVIPCWSERRELSVCVEPRSFADSILLVSPGASVTHREGHVFVVLPVPYVPPSGGPPAELVLRQLAGRGRVITVPALVEPGVPGRFPGQLVAHVPVRRLPGEGHLGNGLWAPHLRVDGRETALRFTLEMNRGRARIQAAGEPGALAVRRSTLGRLLARLPGGRYAVRAAHAIQERYLPTPPAS